ncbi:MAG: hypothetical protein QM757_26535 [Paludibaculum sp.]
MDPEATVELMLAAADSAGLMASRYEYGDMIVFWVEDGVKFLDTIADWEAPEESDKPALQAIQSMPLQWVPFIDPNDGSLRIYIDQE